VAVGGFKRRGGSSIYRTLAETWDGATWKFRTPPNPEGSDVNGLYDVACPTTRMCIAVGEYLTPSYLQRTLTETWNGRAWSIDETPDPPRMAARLMGGISCASANACVSVGSYVRRFRVWRFRPVSELWNGERWTVRRAPYPDGARNSFLAGVSCATAEVCTAVGSYSGASTTVMTLAERFS
jgi:hypothetical protein